tara:strand:- start:865 stop:1041 length:177 start_codon:yes stop_codon:yes gene_type:complete
VSDEEIESLKNEIYTLISSKRGTKDEVFLKKVIELISYTSELKYALKEISKIGGKHTL